MVRAQQVVLFDNGEFYLELGLGRAERTYEINKDAKFLIYSDKPINWPDRLLRTDVYLITDGTDSSIAPVIIRR